jgi:crotonobetainyl-CoA:carnitine CoA-transferase CaiB-like acyl-CoA transferase
MLAMGVLLAVIERAKSGLGQVIDVAMTEGASYVAGAIVTPLVVPEWHICGCWAVQAVQFA